MEIITILLFLIYCFGLGFTATSFVRNSDNFLERNLMRIGIGLSLITFLGLILNFLRLPIDWRIILTASLAYPAFFIFKNFKKFDFSELAKIKVKKTDISIFIMLLIFLGTFYIYGTGAFKYPYLEDDDPWSHAIGVKYVAMEKSLSGEHIRYINPYPPAYDMLLGILNQTNNSVYWTLKFFNALLVSLSVVFFYFFMKEFSGNRNKSLFATFALASIPCFLSHFIWAIALTMPLYFVSFYAIERIKHDNKWWIVAGLVIVTTLTSSPTHSTYFGFFFLIYIATKIFLEKRIPIYHILGGFSGLLLSFIFWWLPMIIQHGVMGTITGTGYSAVAGFSIEGTADRIYTFGDFFWAKTTNMINNPIGIGIVLSILVIFALVSILYKNYGELKKYWAGISAIFLLIESLLLIFLSKTYIKYVRKVGVTPLEPGSVPFFEFLSDQFFFIIALSVMVFVTALLIVKNYKNRDSKEKHLLIVISWLIFTFYAVSAAPFNFKLSPFRAWMLLAIPVCILSAEGAFFLMRFLKKFGIGKIIVLSLIIIGILFTSTYQKYTVNTAMWSPGGFWTSMEEIQGYLWLKENLAPDTKVFTFANNAPIIGMDKFICHWCSNVIEFQKDGFNESAEETYNWLKSNSYGYIVIDGQTVRKFGANESNQKIQEFISTGRFQPAHQTEGMILLKVI
jgi:hypothetical protein